MDLVDLRPLKKLVRRDFPEGSPYRKLVLAQPDKLPKNVAFHTECDMRSTIIESQ
jgi:hypothetical protein